MRIDLFTDAHRPLPLRVGLEVAHWNLGVYPGPPTAISYQPGFFPKPFMAWVLRSMHGFGGWDKGHAELFAAFTSRLNSCHF